MEFTPNRRVTRRTTWRWFQIRLGHRPKWTTRQLIHFWVLLGSIHTYNSITFYLGNAATGDVVLGSNLSVPGVPNGDQTGDNSNRFIGLNNLLAFDRVVFGSSTELI